MLTPEILSDIVEWDTNTWSRGIVYWDDTMKRLQFNSNSMKVLDIGARHGGTSLFFALKGMRCVCSDLNGPSEKARAIHKHYGVSNLIQYEAVDCTCMEFEDASFDLVAFKSVLGGVGAYNNNDNILKAIDEIHRVLKPGGILLFCENTQGSIMHTVLRNRFIKWGKSWNYLSLDFLKATMSKFSEHSIHSYGFLNCLLKDNTVIQWLDEKICKRIKPENQYMCYGYAKK